MSSPPLGARKLRDLSTDDVDKWLTEKAQILSTRTLQEVRFVLKRAITRAPARDKVPIERISRLVGRSSTTTTEAIYRKQIRPVIVHGADIMDRIFPGGADHGALLLT